MTRIEISAVALAIAFVLGAANAQAQTRVLGWGDSLTAGRDWAVWLEQWQPVTVEDHGWNGEQAWRAACDVSAQEPDCRLRAYLDGDYELQAGDVFVLLWGTNDVRYAHWLDSIPGVPNAATSGVALEQIVDDVLEAGGDVVLGIPPPMISSPVSTHTAAEVALYNQRIDVEWRAFVESIAQTRPGIRTFDAYSHFLELPGWPDPSYFAPDGFHPGTLSGTPSGLSGNAHVAEAIEAGLAEPVPALPGALWAALVLAFVLLGGSLADRKGRGRRQALSVAAVLCAASAQAGEYPGELFELPPIPIEELGLPIDVRLVDPMPYEGIWSG